MIRAEAVSKRVCPGNRLLDRAGRGRAGRDRRRQGTGPGGDSRNGEYLMPQCRATTVSGTVDMPIKVAAQNPAAMRFPPAFQRRARSSSNTRPGNNAQLVRHLLRQSPETAVVSPAHVREAARRTVQIGPVR